MEQGIEPAKLRLEGKGRDAAQDQADDEDGEPESNAAKMVSGRVDAVKTEYSKDYVPLDPRLEGLLLEWRTFSAYSSDADWVFANPQTGNPDAHLPRINRNMVYLGACLIAGIRLAREKQVNVRVLPTITAITESVDLAQDIYARVFRKVPPAIQKKHE